MKKLFSESTIIVFIALLTMVINVIPFLFRLTTTPPDRTFVGTQFYTPDYNIYLGHFKEGQKGIWLVHDKHTGEPQKGFLLRREYIIWGFLTGYLLHLPIVFVYHSARIVGGFAVLFLFYLLLKEIFPDEKGKNGLSGKAKRITAFILGTLVAGFSKVTIDPQTGKQTIDLFLYWFTEVDAAARYAPLFHYQIGYIILLSVLLLFIKFIKSNSYSSSPEINRGEKSLPLKCNSSRFSRLERLLSNNNSTILYAIILTLFSAISHPGTFVTIYLTLGIYLILRIFQILTLHFACPEQSVRELCTLNLRSLLKSLFEIRREFLWILALVLITLPVVPFLQSQVNTFPWNEIAKWDLAARTPVDFNDFVMALGPTFFLSILGIIFIFCGEIKKFLLVASEAATKTLGKTSAISPTNCGPQKFSWSTSAKVKLLILSFPLATFTLVFFLWPYLLTINRIRFMQVPIFIPLAILSAITIFDIVEFTANLVIQGLTLNLYRFRIAFHASGMTKDIKSIFNNIFCILTFALLTLIIITFPALKWGVLREVNMFPPGDYLVHPPTKWINAMEWMDKNTKPGEVVLASYHAGGLLPGISGNTSYFGHPWSTVNYGEKEQLMTKFFQGLMTVEEAKKFLKYGCINYVFFGYQEKSYNGDFNKYKNLLTKIYETPEVTIFKVSSDK